MRIEESRNDGIFKEISEFLDDDKRRIKTITLSNIGFTLLEKYLYERDIQVEIINKHILPDEKVEFTLRKM